ncbi:sugar phosphate isomerase/epimerase family protein [Variovorax dokdonensis]|uniref:Sugar phosphate isomerase/epimerase family protein n=1 Tax=Variovorax dokdonensis TaxID=344883 RepID=A0ABT7ND25_9BURK|nr:sugar phosphate isomerase/epimerase family protein [Variovorax dokdonensis]MDM0045740.1 sugar phosphate isomerase/epimerase family protein [Variovorax dokdonensis]
MSIDLARFAFNTVTMGGALKHKLACMKAAGFSAVELWARDLIGHPEGVDAAARIVRESSLAVSDFQPLRDFECAPDAMRPHRLEMAREQLRQMKLVGADLLLVCSTTHPLAIDDPDRAARDLRELADVAAPMGIRICYEALSWGRHVNRWHQAWDIVQRCAHPNVGLNLDSFHMAVHGDDTPDVLAQIAQVPVDKIFLVQLADYFYAHGSTQTDMIELARHQRLFPGEGLHDVRPLVRLLEQRGYRGSYTFEVFNDDYINSDPAVVARRAMDAVHWLGGVPGADDSGKAAVGANERPRTRMSRGRRNCQPHAPMAFQASST